MKRYEEEQAEWVKKYDVEIGDKVKILRGWSSGEKNFEMGMSQARTSIGVIGVIKDIVNTSIFVDSSEVIRSSSTIIEDFIAEIESEIHPIKIISARPNFYEVIKGKRTLKSIHDALDTSVTDFKIRTNELADELRQKLTWMRENTGDFKFLFMDIQEIIYKPFEDLKLLAESRINKHKESQRDVKPLRSVVDKEEAKEEKQKVQHAIVEYGSDKGFQYSNNRGNDLTLKELKDKANLWGKRANRLEKMIELDELTLLSEIEEENRRELDLDDKFYRKIRNKGYDKFNAPSDIDFFNVARRNRNAH